MADEQDFTEEERELAAAASRKTCPDCAETVQSAARVCRYCGHQFDDEAPRDSSSASPSAASSPTRKSPRRPVVLAALAVVILLAGAGAVLLLTQQDGSDDAVARPERVTAADLSQDGAFWQSLTPDLKDDLVAFAKDRLGQERDPSLDNNQLVAEIDREYTNEAKRGQDIYGTYVAANNALAEENVDDIIDELEEEVLDEEELQGDVQGDLEDFIREDADQKNEEDGFPERVTEVGCVPETDTTYRCLVDFDDGTQLSGQGTYDPDTGDLLYELE